jgi:flagellar basal-body rod modification protein FlgD
MGTSAVSGFTGISTTNDAASAISNPKAALDKNSFLKLLVAQMKNQDPDKPMDGSQMAAQLAQFSSVEQLMQINTTLASQQTGNTSLVNSVNNNIALGSIGKTIYAAGNQVEIGNGADQTAHVIIGGAGTGTLQLLDANGTVVGTRDLGAVHAGEQDFSLGGLELGLPAGVYSYQLNVADAKGVAVPVTQMIHGKVDGVSYTANGTTLTIGKLSVPVSSIVSVKTS